MEFDRYDPHSMGYDSDPRSLKRRRSPAGGGPHYGDASRSPYATAEYAGGYLIDPTRTDPEYLEWAARQRAKERAALSGPAAGHPVGAEWDRQRDYKRPYDDGTGYGRGGGEDERYAPRMRGAEEWDREGRGYSRDERERDYGYDRHAPDYDRPRWGPGERERPHVPSPYDYDTLLPYKRFAQMLREAGTEPVALASTPEASNKLFEIYTAYRATFQSRAMHRFWSEHKDAAWFQERYGLGEDDSNARTLRRKLGRVGRKEQWLEELKSGKIDGVCFDLRAAPAKLLEPLPGGLSVNAGKGYLSHTTRAGEEVVLPDIETVSTPANPFEVMVRHVPAEMKRLAVEDTLREIDGFKYLAMGEPHLSKRWGRMGWAVFETGTDMEKTLDSLNAKLFDGAKLVWEVTDRDAHSRLRIAPPQSCALARLTRDLRQTRELIAVLEEEDRTLFAEEAPEWSNIAATAEIEQQLDKMGLSRDGRSWEDIENDVLGGFKDAEGGERAQPTMAPRLKDMIKKHLDLNIDLLRNVYHCDYYAGILCDFPEELVRRAPQHLRRCPINENVEATTTTEKVWADNVDQRIELLTKPALNDLEPYGGRNLDTAMQELAAPYSQQDDSEKHRCIVPLNADAAAGGALELCNKPFKAAIFVRKHVINKHRAFFDEKVGQQVKDIREFNNYVRDPSRTMPTLQPQRRAEEDRARGRTRGAHARAGDAAGPELAQRLGGQSTGYETAAAPLPLHYPGTTMFANGGLMRMGGSTPVAAAAPSVPFDAPSRRPAPPHLAINNGGGGASASPSGGGGSGLPLGARLGPLTPVPDMPTSEPLPRPPKPLDPRARQAPRTYEDLDGAATAEAGEIQLEY